MVKRGKKRIAHVRSTPVVEEDDDEKAQVSSQQSDVEENHVKEEGGSEEKTFPAHLGLRRVTDDDKISHKIKHDTPTPQTPLNRRGMPMRIRKKNKLFYDDDDNEDTKSIVPKSMLKAARNNKMTKRSKKAAEDTSMTNNNTTSSVGSPPTTPIKNNVPKASEMKSTPLNERKLGQKMGLKLRNMIKLPKAHKWVIYEWFYSNLDQVLLGGENDFTGCVKESFPELKTTKLTRGDWCKMRKLMGRPRRCSQSFFDEERSELDRRRAKIRQLQQRKPTDISNCKDLPPEIPLQLVIGTKVSALLRTPHDGILNGSVDAYDVSNNTYRIRFDKFGIGTFSVPDSEVLSVEPPETISVISMINALRPTKLCQLGNLSDPNSSTPAIQTLAQKDMESNKFPIDALKSIVHLSKIIDIKKGKVNELRDMNADAEKAQIFGNKLSNDFIRKYASVIVELEQINQYLRNSLNIVQHSCQEVTPSVNVGAVLTPNYIREQSLLEAKNIVEDVNEGVVQNVELLDLITELVGLIIQIKSCSDADRNCYEIEVLTKSMDSIKSKLTPLHRSIFENLIEVHMKHLQSAMSGDTGTFSPFFQGQTNFLHTTANAAYLK